MIQNITDADKELTYAEALAAVGRADYVSMHFDFSVVKPPYPESKVDPALQVKLAAATMLMEFIGKGPGDLPIDQTIPYRKLSTQSLEWLENSGVPIRRKYAPLAARDCYIRLFGDDQRSPVPSDQIGRFYNMFIHCLAIESEILVALQYFQGLGLVKDNLPLSLLNIILSPEHMAGLRLAQLNQISLSELHGRIFFEYCVIMIRAQWDKIVRLTCMVFNQSTDRDSVSRGISRLNRLADDKTNLLHPFCRYHLNAFKEIAQDRLTEDSWLQTQRNNLLHKVGQHSSGVLPHTSSFETTTELFAKVRNEHNWLREAMMSAIISYLTAKLPSKN